MKEGECKSLWKKSLFSSTGISSFSWESGVDISHILLTSLISRLSCIFRLLLLFPHQTSFFYFYVTLDDTGKFILVLFSVGEEYVIQELSCRWTLIRVLGEASRDEALEVGAPLGIDRRWVPSDNVQDDLLLVLLDVRCVAICELEGENASRPYINFAVVFLLPLDELGRHPADSADTARSMFPFCSELG